MHTRIAAAPRGPAARPVAAALAAAVVTAAFAAAGCASAAPRPPRLPAAEGERLWMQLCASCHGATGHLEGVAPADPRPRAFGTVGMSMGFFFGGDKMRAGLYRKIARGEPPAAGPVPSPMPKWEGALSEAQIWALVDHIESL